MAGQPPPRCGRGALRVSGRDPARGPTSGASGTPASAAAPSITASPTTALAAGSPSIRPSPTPAPTQAVLPLVIHIVLPGESLTSIGAIYGVTPQAIRHANHIKDPNLLRIGQKLIIPRAP